MAPCPVQRARMIRNSLVNFFFLFPKPSLSSKIAIEKQTKVRKHEMTKMARNDTFPILVLRCQKKKKKGEKGLEQKSLAGIFFRLSISLFIARITTRAIITDTISGRRFWVVSWFVLLSTCQKTLSDVPSNLLVISRCDFRVNRLTAHAFTFWNCKESKISKFCLSLAGRSCPRLSTWWFGTGKQGPTWRRRCRRVRMASLMGYSP